MVARKHWEVTFHELLSYNMHQLHQSFSWGTTKFHLREADRPETSCCSKHGCTHLPIQSQKTGSSISIALKSYFLTTWNIDLSPVFMLLLTLLVFTNPWGKQAVKLQSVPLCSSSCCWFSPRFDAGYRRVYQGFFSLKTAASCQLQLETRLIDTAESVIILCGFITMSDTFNITHSLLIH